MFNSEETKKVFKYGAVVLVVLAVFLAVQVVHTLVQTMNIDRYNPAVSVIAVNGLGEKVVVPDIATFSFAAEMTSETVASAQQVVTERMNKALEIVKAAGVAEKDIKTINYSINPHYQYTQPICTQYNCPPGKQTLTGYDVNQTVEIKIRDTSKAGDILGKLGEAEITNLSGLTFTIDEKEKVAAEVRAIAIADARAKAKVLAKNLGVSLGRVVNFSEGNYLNPLYSYDSYGKGGDGAVPAPAINIPVGENKIVSNVSIRYEIR